MDVLVLALFFRATLVLADMTNDGVNPEHGLQYGQTAVPSRVCKFFFFVRLNPFKKLLTYTVCFLDCGRTACIILLHFEAVALR